MQLTFKKYISNIGCGILSVLKSKIFLCSLLTQVASLGWFGVGVSLDNSKTSSSLSLPCFLGFIIYSILVFIFIPIVHREGNLGSLIKKYWWKYTIISTFEFEGTFCLVLAYRWANYTVLQFLDYSSNVFVLIISIVVLRKKFFAFHYIGSLVAIIGVVILIINDPDADDSSPETPRFFIGELVCLVGCFLYTCSDVLSEKYLTETKWYQWLALFGLTLCPITLIQGLIIEAIWPSNIGIDLHQFYLLILYIFSSLVYYVVMPICLSNIGAACVHLLLMSSEIYAVIYTSLKDGKITYIVWVSIALTFLGNIIFSLQTLYSDKKAKAKSDSEEVQA